MKVAINGAGCGRVVCEFLNVEDVILFNGHPLANVGLKPITYNQRNQLERKSRKSDRKRNRANRWKQ